MAKTVTEVEVKKTTAINNHTARKARPAREEQGQWLRWPWIAAPITLAAAAGAAFLVARRWLNNSDSTKRPS